MQEHVFSPEHIARIRAILENGDKVPGYNINTDNQCDDDDDNEGDDKRNEQLQQLKNFKTKSPVAIDPANDKLGFYNQFLLQNNMLNVLASNENQMGVDQNETENEGFLNMLRMQQQQLQLQQKNTDECAKSSNSNGINDNILLSINADKSGAPATNNNEILQQLYSYSQMSGKLIR